ncbi:hypothetical protein, unlikely [Trypanosoma brucei brucei TREU927]|uniref:Uncharacterized protein n=1 Tax=Trypanosoma brucei brucei (strain 927/4 GUTat10.1) TaxID=185431 RepID=Q38CN7_TRYB2|nr:hypothetical protein, unlikely [Trypanosoma brucei brucei TREU927]EAN77433.1 hypothetical protein, unlikely [Trypanosoma brucei brucei TREU927]
MPYMHPGENFPWLAGLVIHIKIKRNTQFMKRIKKERELKKGKETKFPVPKRKWAQSIHVSKYFKRAYCVRTKKKELYY